MNKKAILPALLFTTVLSSGIVFAGDRNDEMPFASPTTQGKIMALPKTDEIVRKAGEMYPDEVFSPDSAGFHRGLFIDEEIQKREDEKHRLAAGAKSKQIKQQEQLAIEAAEEETRIAVAALKAKIEENTLAKTQTESQALQLASRIRNLEVDLREMEEKVEQEEAKVQAEKEKKTKVMVASTEAMNEMKRRLNESRATIAALKEERDQLESTKVVLGKREEGLLAQITLVKTHLDSTMTVDPNVASGHAAGGGTVVPNPNLSSALASTTILPSAAGTSTVLPDPAILDGGAAGKPSAGGGVLPKANFRKDKK